MNFRRSALRAMSIRHEKVRFSSRPAAMAACAAFVLALLGGGAGNALAAPASATSAPDAASAVSSTTAVAAVAAGSQYTVHAGQSLNDVAIAVTQSHVLADVKRFREADDKTPVVLMGYANPIERMGAEAFAKAAKEAGVDGVLVVDYPPEECANFAEQMQSAGIDPIFLLAPTSTDERIAEVGRIASGYVYYVSLKGVTGAANLDVSSIASKIPAIKSRVPLPVGVGFGIRDAQTARAVGEVADAVVIGSRIVQLLEQAAPDAAAETLTRFIAEVREALDSLANAR